MQIIHSETFLRDWNSLPQEIKKRAEKQISLFLSNPRHPSLRIKKMKGFEDVWEGRVTRNYRFTFQIKMDACVLRRIGTHDILKKAVIL